MASIKPGEGVYAELTSEGTLKDTVYVRENDKFVPTVRTLQEVRFVDSSGKPISSSIEKYTSRKSSRSRSTTVDQPVQPSVITGELRTEKEKARDTKNQVIVQTRSITQPKLWDYTVAGSRERQREQFERDFAGLSSGEALSRVKVTGYGSDTSASYESPIRVEAVATPFTGLTAREKVAWTFSGARFKGFSEYEFKTQVLSQPTLKDASVGLGLKTSEFFQSLPSRYEEVTRASRVSSTGEFVEPSRFQRGLSSGVRAVSVVGDVVIGESFQKPEETLGLYTVGGVVGFGAKALKIGTQPLMGRIAILAKSTPSVGWATKGIGLGFRAGAVLGVGGLVAQDIVLADDKFKQVVRIGKDFALFGAGYSKGFSTTFRDLTVKATGEIFVIGKSPGFDYVPFAGKEVTATFTRSGGFGGYISDKEIIRKTGQDLFLAKGSPLGLPRDYYQSLQTGLKAGKVSSRGFAEPYKFFEPRVSAKTGEAFGADLVRVGEVQKKLAEPIVRVVNIRTGKERDVASRFLDKTLAEDSSLKVVGVTKKKDLLFASDLFGAIAIGIQEKGFVSYKPSFVTSPPPSVVLRQPILDKPFSMPLVFSPSFLSKTGVESLGVEAVGVREDVRFKPIGGALFTPISESWSRAKLGVESVSESVSLNKVRGAVRSDIRFDVPTITTPVTTTVPVTSSVPVQRSIVRPVRSSFRPVQTPSLRFTPFSLPRIPSGFVRGVSPGLSFKGFSGSLSTAFAGERYLSSPVVGLSKTDSLGVEGKKKLRKVFEGWRF